jgi:hypothetical protein
VPAETTTLASACEQPGPIQLTTIIRRSPKTLKRAVPEGYSALFRELIGRIERLATRSQEETSWLE